MHDPVPLSVRIKAFFAHDKKAFWWDHFTNEEKQLRRMDAWQLATIIHEESIRQTAPEKRIVAEHLLNVRLAQIQATASWGSGVLCFVGAIIGAAMSIALTSALQSPKEVKCNPERASEKQAVSAPVQKQPEPIARPPENMPSTPIIEVTPSKQGDINRPQHRQNTKQPKTPTNP